MDELFQYLDALYPLAAEIRVALVNRIPKETYRKNKVLLYSGQSCDWIAFIEKGLVKVCYDVPGGDERIVSFHRSGEVACTVKSFTAGIPAKVSMITMDETVIRKMAVVELESIAVKHPVFNIHLRKITELHSVLMEDYYLLMTLPPRQRLEKLISEKSWIMKDKRIKQFMVADYIGVNKVTVSRWGR